MFRVVWAIATLALGGCWYASPISSRGHGWTSPTKPFVPPDRPLDEWRQLMVDRTWMYYSKYVFYTPADGRAFLWYAGEKRLFIGEWKLEKVPRPGARGLHSMLCFRYPGAATHPASEKRGDEWSCGEPFFYLGGDPINHPHESIADDVFGLAGRRDAPFVFTWDERMTLAKLQARLRR